MKRFAVILFALSLGACANLQNAWNTVTGATVSPQAVYLAENGYDALEVTAKNYLHICRTAPKTPGCSAEAISKVIPAVRAGRVARTNLDAFMKAHPDALGASGLYDALISATNTLQSIATTYNIAGVSK